MTEIIDRINELHQIIDTETEPAEAGSLWSRAQVINAQAEIDRINESLNQVIQVFNLT
ncbi:hypothetical protein OAA62_00985 [bacterium]|nr:hypothetical protein [bacterium]